MRKFSVNRQFPQIFGSDLRKPSVYWKFPHQDIRCGKVVFYAVKAFIFIFILLLKTMLSIHLNRNYCLQLWILILVVSKGMLQIEVRVMWLSWLILNGWLLMKLWLNGRLGRLPTEQLVKFMSSKFLLIWEHCSNQHYFTRYFL